MFSPAYDIGRPLDTTPTSPRSRRSIALPKLRTRRLSSGSPAREPTLLTAPVSLRPCDASYYDCLPHVRATLKSLVDKKGYRIEAILAEDKVFVSPPNKNRQWEEEVWDLAPEEETPTIVSGLVAIFSPNDRIVTDLHLSLTGEQTIAFQSRGDAWPSRPPEEFDVFRSETSLSSEGEPVALRKGLNTFAFAFHLPASTAPSISSSYGRLRYILRTTVPSSGSVLKGKGKLSARKLLNIVAIPPRRRDGTDLCLAVKKSSNQNWSGPQLVEISADETILGGALWFHLTLPSPSSTLQILGVRCYVAQTVVILSPSGLRQVVGSPRKLVFLRGKGYGWEAAGGEEGEGELGTGKDQGGVKVFDSASWKGGDWKFEQEGIIPLGNVVRATTPSSCSLNPGGLKFGSELVVEVLYAPSAGEKAAVETIWRGKIDLASPDCTHDALTVPKYSP